MADRIKKELGVSPSVVIGATSEFSVHVNGEMVLKKGFLLLPSEKRVVEAVRAALAKAGSAPG